MAVHMSYRGADGPHLGAAREEATRAEHEGLGGALCCREPALPQRHRQRLPDGVVDKGAIGGRTGGGDRLGDGIGCHGQRLSPLRCHEPDARAGQNQVVADGRREARELVPQKFLDGGGSAACLFGQVRMLDLGAAVAVFAPRAAAAGHYLAPPVADVQHKDGLRADDDGVEGNPPHRRLGNNVVFVGQSAPQLGSDRPRCQPSLGGQQLRHVVLLSCPYTTGKTRPSTPTSSDAMR